jgi:hypothetical protein
MPGARCTRSPCARVVSTRIVTTGSPGHPAFPCAMVLTVSSGLSLVTGLVCHHRQRDAKHHRQLDASVGASGPHGFAVRAQRHSSLDVAASIASPRPTSVTIAKRPSCGCGMAVNRQVICVGSEPKYFCARGWTLSRCFARPAQSVCLCNSLVVILRCSPSASLEGCCVVAHPSRRARARTSSDNGEAVARG